MWSTRQSLIIDQLCALSNLPEFPASIKTHVALTVDGISISLLPGRTADSISIVVQLGHPAKHLELHAYKKLLALNLVIDQGNHQRMAIDPVTGTALFIYEIFSGDATDVLISLQRAAACAKTWQQDHFLEPQSLEGVA